MRRRPATKNRNRSQSPGRKVSRKRIGDIANILQSNDISSTVTSSAVIFALLRVFKAAARLYETMKAKAFREDIVKHEAFIKEHKVAIRSNIEKLLETSCTASDDTNKFLLGNARYPKVDILNFYNGVLNQNVKHETFTYVIQLFPADSLQCMSDILMVAMYDAYQKSKNKPRIII